MPLVTITETVEMKNISAQTVVINVKSVTSASDYFRRQGGEARIPPQAVLEVEEARLDLQQLKQLRKHGLLTTTNFSRQATTASSSGTGSE
jgi:hypothetical protein